MNPTTKKGNYSKDVQLKENISLLLKTDTIGVRMISSLARRLEKESLEEFS